MEPELITFLILFFVVIAILVGLLWQRKRKGDFDIGKRMRLANDARNARQTLVAK
jgi:hypothetical protein